MYVISQLITIKDWKRRVIVFFDLFGEFDHFEDSDAAEQRGKRI